MATTYDTFSFSQEKKTHTSLIAQKKNLLQKLSPFLSFLHPIFFSPPFTSEDKRANFSPLGPQKDLPLLVFFFC